VGESNFVAERSCPPAKRDVARQRAGGTAASGGIWKMRLIQTNNVPMTRPATRRRFTLADARIPKEELKLQGDRRLRERDKEQRLSPPFSLSLSLFLCGVNCIN